MMDRILELVKLLRPGLRFKRWIVLLCVALGMILLGVPLATGVHTLDLLKWPNAFWTWFEQLAGVPMDGASGAGMGMLLILAGLALVCVALAHLGSVFMAALSPAVSPTRLVDAVYRDRVLKLGPRVVVLGGGTGLSTMLRGLKQYSSNLVAVVTVTDDGGSSGKLQKQLNVLPPGDIRNCLVAMADAEGTMTDLFQYRFRRGGAENGLRDHAFGNLLIAAMTEIAGGDFEEGIRRTSKVLNIRGRVLPSTLQHVRLRAEMEDGSVIEGETAIVHSPLRIRRVALDPPDAQAPEEVLEAIELADIIVLGPGSAYTSVAPNLLVRGIPEALRRARAPKVYVCNVMTQPGETDGFAASDHLKAIEAHVSRPIVDYVVVNTGVPSMELLNKYRQSGATLVQPDIDVIRRMGRRTVVGNFISQTDVVRHDAVRLAEAIMGLLPKSAWSRMLRERMPVG